MCEVCLCALFRHRRRPNMVSCCYMSEVVVVVEEEEDASQNGRQINIIGNEFCWACRKRQACYYF